MKVGPRRFTVTAAVTAGLVASLGLVLPVQAQEFPDPGARWIGPGFPSAEGTEDCDPCVRDMLGQLNGDAGLGLNRRSRNFRTGDPTSGAYLDGGHNQGVALLRDTVVGGQRVGRAAISFNANDNSGLMIASRTIPEGQPGIDDGHDRLHYNERKHWLDVMDRPSFGDHHHPGGLQAQGDMLAIAMEQPQGSDKRAAVYFVNVDGTTPRHVATHWIDGAAPSSVRRNAAATVGFTRRYAGGFVMAVSGADNGKAGVWFYITDDPVISATTQWRYVDFWNPKEEMPRGVCNIDEGKRGNDCFIGGGGATGLVTGCDGQLYLVVLTGTNGGGIDDEYAQVLRVGQDSAGEVRMTSIWNSKRKVGRLATNQISMRWGAGVQVLPGGRLAFLSTERRTVQDANERVDGIMRIGGSNTQPM